MKRILGFLRQWWLFNLAILALIISLTLYFTNFHFIAYIVLSVVSIGEIIPLVICMWDDIRNGTYGLDILAATAIIASVLLGQYWAAIVVVIMLTGGESLESYADKRALSELKSLLDNAPTTAHLLKNKKQLDVNANSLKIGDRIIVKVGETVPTDGVVIEGSSSLNESSLTGEGLPVFKDQGQSVLSGSINLDGPLVIKATALAKDSQYQQIIKLVESAAASKAPFVRLADRYSIPFTVFAYGLAGATWAITGHAIRFLEVIIVATPCPLLLAAPIALISGMSRASRWGIIVKNGSALEKLAEAKTIAFDKTGTLTSAKLTVNNVKANNGFSNNDVLTYAASLEQFSNHVVAKSITDYAHKKKLKLQKVKGLEEIHGLGMRAKLKSKKLSVGRLSLLKEEGIKVPKKLSNLKQASTAVFVGLDNQLVGYITLEDQIRSEAKRTLKSLANQGLDNFMLVTGDNQQVAKKVARKLGIKSITAEALPVDKLRVIEKTINRPIAFVGDGVNDAPVLRAADIGIALGAKGSAAASESADMVIMLDDLGHVASAYKIAKHTFKIAKQSILIGIGLSLVLMVIFASGHFLPVYGAILQEVVDVFVIFNALRAHSIKLSSSAI